MADLRIERSFACSPERLFAVVTEPGNLVDWWGPEGMDIPEGDLDFTRTGPWDSVMRNKEGQRYKVSGEVTQVDPPNAVGFTWAWHDENDIRGHESHVTFTILPDGRGAKLVLDHRNLADDSTSGHEDGWTSTFNKLAAYLT